MSNILVLHGWRASVASFDQFSAALNELGYTVFVPELPGFGSSALDQAWTLDDYVLWTKQYIQEHALARCVVVGHSFGGQIAVALAVQDPVLLSKLVLVSSAAIRRPVTFKGKIRYYFSHIAGLFSKMVGTRGLSTLLASRLRTDDYQQVSPLLRETMRQVLKEDLYDQLHNIDVPTLLCWGEEDRATPLALAHLHQQQINDAQLYTFPNVGHNLPYEKPKELAQQIDSFIKEV